jgi:hypothetical protein
VIYHVLEHVICQVTYFYFDHVGLSYLTACHVSLVSQDHVLVLSQDLLVGLLT